MSAFKNITVQPSYGAKTTLVSWELKEGYEGGTYVYRSPDGAGDWERLNDEPVEDNYFQDTNFIVKNIKDVPHYRLLLVTDEGQEFDSPIIGVLEQLTRNEYQGLSKMMKMEYMRMSRGNGIQILHYKVRTKGEVSSLIDTVTGALIADPSCPDDETYGEKFEGGFRRPVLTWMEMIEVGPLLVLDKKEGLGAVDDNQVMARMLAFPRPVPGDMIVHVPTDNRYSVGAEVKPYMFRGIMPLCFMAKLTLLQRNDPRYRVPIPDKLPPEITRP